MKAKIFLLLLGLAIGLAAAVLFPRLREQLTPSVLRRAPTEGVVEEKRTEPDRLLLTLVTADGAVLAIFTRKVPEIDLLVAPGDTVSLALDGYRPFVEDPEIERVVKANLDGAETRLDDSAESPAEPAGEAPAALPSEGRIEPEADDPAAAAPVDPPARDPGEPEADERSEAPAADPAGPASEDPPAPPS